ncbi:uncharacterized protein A4U43_C02F10160 [Asparagus officinalis]|uniref:BHLH domain-containing protein n=1 Tax=Asparagus officinalis TaxID=4686 RepID=A0A5P1FM51_ASPOF|nr:transcription factor bHLH128-like isoform X2 [Asparagus officinalis]ONK77751.1 uncharacterized protein A4U43_C02F10160 [Asparagus officinalis]
MEVCGDHLMRQSSSPAGFFSQLMVDSGYAATRSIGHYSHPVTNNIHTMPHTRLKSQLSFSSQEPLSQISENNDETDGNVAHSYVSNSFSIGSWDDTNSIAFSSPSNKRAKNSSEDFIKSLSHIDSQFSLPTTSLEMAAVENLFQAQQDSVAFKVRAKRGCATHPRSIAERERRTRISEKLRKLQELVPNMDKQTSTADMLDLAVQHIKELQSQVQNLNQEQANCTCECKKELP